MVTYSLLLSALSLTAAYSPRRQAAFKPYSQDFEDQFNVLKYTGGSGPYSNRIGEGISPEVPDGCEVEQVIMLARHGERYPSPGSAELQSEVLDKVLNSKSEFKGSLAFLNNGYDFYVVNEGYAGLETEQGPYSGLSNWHSVGADYSQRYGHLWQKDEVTPIFVAGYERVLQSARKFGEGFFAYNYTDSAAINILPELEELGADTLSTWNCPAGLWTTCPVANQSEEYPDRSPFQFPQFDIAALRLNKESGLDLNGSDIFQLMNLASFEISARGDSPWVGVFTTDEWITFEYANDLWMHCWFGSGSPRSMGLGSVYINNTVEMLNKGPEGYLPLVFGFAHDTDITSALAAAGIIEPTKEMSLDKVVFGHGYRITDIVPMAARFTIERLRCQAPGLTNDTNVIAANSSAASTNDTNLDNWTNGTYTTIANGTYSNDSTTSTDPSIFVRVLLNEAVVPLEFCYDGPGYSCSLDDYTAFMNQRVEMWNYAATCQPEEGTPLYSTFWWNYNTTNDLNYPSGEIPFQSGFL